jgi:hypothetical protein
MCPTLVDLPVLYYFYSPRGLPLGTTVGGTVGVVCPKLGLVHVSCITPTIN